MHSSNPAQAYLAPRQARIPGNPGMKASNAKTMPHTGLTQLFFFSFFFFLQLPYRPEYMYGKLF
jgi:hypothetical protein